MKAGTLHHEATIERLDNTTTELDSRGQTQESWGRVARVRGSLIPLSGTEAFQVHQQFATASHVFTCRYVASITPQCRVVCRGRTFAVNQIQNVDERDREVRLVLTEEV